MGKETMSIRVRFAPSPTGYLHIGGARTALFNWLYARHAGGVFVLRIEDTDTARNTAEAVEVILKGLRWLGLEWDEGPVSGDPAGPSKGGFGPYFQSQRSAIYARRIADLKAKGLAYEAEGTVKFRMPREPIVIQDLVVGEVKRELTDREAGDPDFVIVRSDGQPVFHLVNVVDDIEMQITHVIRGEDHLANTAKHLALFRAFGATPPQYAHIPLILNPDGSKMSKRDQGASLMTYVDEGYLPEAVVNYLLLLGWSPKDNRQVLPLEEVVRKFDLPQILRHNARFDMTKLNWMNGKYLRTIDRPRFKAMGAAALARAGVGLAEQPPAYVDAALETCHQKVELISELPAYAGFYFQPEVEVAEADRLREFTPENLPRMAQLRADLAALAEFTAEKIEATMKATAASLGVGVGVLVHPTRLACTANAKGPSLYHLMAILGQPRVIKSLDRMLAGPVGA
jgi:glutamyl-tRNA synthetase